MNRIIFLAMALFGLGAIAQTRIIPHVTPLSGDFSTTFILVNPETSEQRFVFTPYLDDGSALDTVSGTLAADETRIVSSASLFGQTISHCSVEGGTIEMALAYRDAEATASSAHVLVGQQTAYRWQLQPGELSDVVDGIAVVNTDASPQDIQVRQLSRDGSEMARFTVLTLDSMAKGLYLFGDFEAVEGAYYEIFADAPLALTSLRFATGSARYFWSSAALALPALTEPVNTAPVITGQETLSIQQGNSLTLMLSQLTVEDDGDPANLVLTVADGANYSREGNTITPDTGFSGTLSVPVSVSDGSLDSDTYNVSVEVTAASDPRVGLIASFPNNPTYGISGRAVIADEHTIRLENFSYNGQGPDVRLYLGKNGDYANGIDLSGTLSGTAFDNETVNFTLPDQLTLNDFDGISVWCAIFSVDFSSGIFQ